MFEPQTRNLREYRYVVGMNESMEYKIIHNLLIIWDLHANLGGKGMDGDTLASNLGMRHSNTICGLKIEILFLICALHLFIYDIVKLYTSPTWYLEVNRTAKWGR